MKKVFCLILCTMLALFAAASAETFTFITPTDNEPASLNQLKGWTGDFFNNMYLLQAGLFRYQNGEVKNELCSDYTVSDDGLVYTFTIRDAQYSDGVEIKAQDFVFMMKSYLDPANGVSGGSFYKTIGLVNGEAFFNGEVTDFEQVGVKALDDKTLQMTLTAPNDALVSSLAYYIFSPLREDVLAAYGEAMGSAPDKMVYSGAYCLTEWTAGVKLTMKKNANYWNADNAFPMDELIHLLVGDSNTTYSLYENGEADAIINVDAEYVDLLGDDIVIQEGNRIEFLWLNTSGASEETAALMGNINFRKALSYALNREAIVAAISPVQTPYTRVTMPLHFDDEGNRYIDLYQPDTVPVTGDFDAAKAYLEAAMSELGYASVNELPALQFVTYENALLKIFGETMVDQWKQVLGLTNIQFNQYAIGTALDKIYSADFDMFFIGNAMGDDVAGLYDSFMPGGDYDFGCWTGDEFEAFKAAAEAIKGKTGADRTAALADAEQKFLDAAFIVPIFQHNDVHACQSYVSGMKTGVLGYGYIFDELTVSR